MAKVFQKIKYKTHKPDVFDEVEMGNVDTDSFDPHAKLKKWGDEAWLKVWRETDKVQTRPIMEGGKSKWKGRGEEVHFYPLGERSFLEGGKRVTQLREGGLELELILKEIPSSNIITFRIDSQNLHFAKQLGELTEQEVENGTFRPQNVYGSYAVYHKTRKSTFYNDPEEAEKYKVNKVFHIYTPEIVDAVGNKTWGELNIDTEVGTLRITIDQSWLENAVYPVSVDPTFGYESIGSEISSSTESRILFNYYSSGGADEGDATKLTAYVKADVADLASKFAIYDSSLNGITNGETPEVADTPTTAAWQDYTYSSKPSISNSTQYNFAWRAETTASDKGTNMVDVYRDYDVDNFDQYEFKWDTTSVSAYSDAWPASISNDGTEAQYRRHSVYCTTEAAATGIASKRLLIGHGA